MERRGELALTILIVIALAAGLTWDVLGKPVTAPAPEAAAGSLFNERALFCPGLPRHSEGSTSVATWSSSGDSADVSVGTSAQGATELPGNEMRVETIQGREAFNVVGSGAPMLANVNTSFTKRPGSGQPFDAVGAAQCSDQSATDWYFPEGSSAFRYDEHLLIYNPFPDEAVVRVVFLTPAGEQSKAGLAQIGVPSGKSADVDLNTYITQKDSLAIHISAVRGRVVAWKMLFSHPSGRPPGVEFSLGATEPMTQAFFPIGVVDDHSSERITILNPSDGESVLTVSLMTKAGVVQPTQFREMHVRRRSTRVLDLNSLSKHGPPLGPVSATLEVLNGVGVMAEESLALGSGGLKGVAADMGLPEPADSWWLGPAAAKPTRDVIVLFNLGGNGANVDLTLLSEGGAARRPASLQNLKVGSGERAEIALPAGSGVAPVVRLDSDQPVVAGRLAQGGGDIGLVGGAPITPSAP
jgi:hypothetical protein